MSETRFTPGPWHVRSEPREEDGYITAWPIDKSDTECICDVWGGHERAEADSALIASAPALYEALERTLDRLQAVLAQRYVSDGAETFAEAERAMAQARGEHA